MPANRPKCCWHHPTVETTFAIANPPRTWYCCWCNEPVTVKPVAAREPDHGPHLPPVSRYILPERDCPVDR